MDATIIVLKWKQDIQWGVGTSGPIAELATC